VGLVERNGFPRHRRAFFRDLLEVAEAPSWGPFTNLLLDWADPQMRRAGETNTGHGGRGVYFKDPAGHAVELLTRPYL
jgi:hypothetical protein